MLRTQAATPVPIVALDDEGSLQALACTSAGLQQLRPVVTDKGVRGSLLGHRAYAHVGGPFRVHVGVCMATMDGACFKTGRGAVARGG